MQLRLMAVFDKKLGVYDPPFTVRHLGEAIRSWETVTKDKNTRFGMHPSDYDLYQIGTYEEETGRIISSEQHTHVASGV